MKIGVMVGDDPWYFFQPVYDDLIGRHEVEVYRQRTVKTPVLYYRINRTIQKRDLDAFLQRQDVVFCEWASEYLAAATHRPKQCSIITRLHRYEMFEWLDKINWGNVDSVILVSEAMRRKFAARLPEHAHKTVVIPVGIAIDKFKPVTKEFGGDIGTLCHLVPRKRVYDLILAFFEMNRVRNGFHLHIGGGSHGWYTDYFEAIHALVRRLDLQDQVTFYGNVTEQWKWYSLIDIFVSNSYSEGLQVAPMEAMASGRHCLSHHWEGAEELLPPDSLFFTDREMIEKILAYSDLTEGERRQHQEKMRFLACERYNLEIMLCQIRQVIEEFARK